MTTSNHFRTTFRITVLTILIFIAAATSGQTSPPILIEGLVLDSTTLEPIVGATVMLTQDNAGADTDESGRFEINIGRIPSPLQFRVSAVGYTTFNGEPPLEWWTDSLVFYLAQKSIPVNDIVVTSSRFAEQVFETTQGVSVVSAEEFEGRSFSTTSELLREEPGVLVQKTTAGHGAPIIRGMIGKYVLLLYDGIRLNKPTFRFGANQYLNTVDLESLDRIEVVRGPSSVMYGSDAIGGAVNLIPGMMLPRNGDIEFSPRFVTRFSSADEGKSAHADVTIGTRHISGAVGFTLKDVGDLRAGGCVDKQQPTGWKEQNLSTRLTWHTDDRNALTFDYLMVRQDEIPRYDKYVTGEFERYVYDPQDRNLVGLTWSAETTDKTIRSVRCNISYQKETEGKQTQKTGSNTTKDYEDVLTTWGGYAQMAIAARPEHMVFVGGEYYSDVVSSYASESESIGGVVNTGEIRGTFPDDSKYSSLGLFVQDEWSYCTCLKLTAGLRYSRITMQSPLEPPFGYFDEGYDNMTGALSVSYMPIESLNLIGRWSRGFRAPNLNDALVLKYSSSGVDAPSLDLSPENSNNTEVGVKIRTENTSETLMFFYNRLSNMIDRRPGSYDGLSFLDENGNGIQDQDEYDIYQKFNVGKARIYGFEFNGSWSAGDRWQFRSNCFWTRGENETDDEPMSRIPPLMGMVAARYVFDEQFWAEAYVRAAGEQDRLSQRDTDDTRIGPDGTPGWVTLNLRGRKVFGDIAATLAVENVTDKLYKEHGSGVYSSGRNFVLTLSYGGR